MDLKREILVCGSDAVGKTNLIANIVFERFLEDGVEIDDTFQKCIDVDGKTAYLTIVDTTGSEMIGIRDMNYRRCHGVLLCYSITSRKSFEAVREIYDNLSRVKDAFEFPLILVGTKSDLEEEREVTFEEGKELANFMFAMHKETSAKENKNVMECYVDLVKLIQQAEDKRVVQQVRKK